MARYKAGGVVFAGGITVAEIDVTENITVGGTVDGLDLSTVIPQVNLIGEENKQWINCILVISRSVSKPELRTESNGFSNDAATGGSTSRWAWDLPLPTTMGDYSLYVDGQRMSVGSLGTFEIDIFYIRGWEHAASTPIADWYVDASSGNLYERTFAEKDCSEYNRVRAYTRFTAADANSFVLYFLELRCHYK